MTAPALALPRLSFDQNRILERIRYGRDLHVQNLIPAIHKKAAQRIETQIIAFLPEPVREAARREVARRIRQRTITTIWQPGLLEETSSRAEEAAAIESAEEWLSQTIQTIRKKGGRMLDLVGHDTGELRVLAKGYAEINQRIAKKYQNQPQKLEAWAYGTHQLGWTVPGEDLYAVIDRLTDEKCWRRRLLRQVRPLKEYTAQVLGMVRKGKAQYVSDSTLTDFQDMQEASEAWVNDTVIVRRGEDGKEVEIPMARLVKQKHRAWLAETHARVNGIGRLATEEGLKPFLVTLTLASRWHPVSPKYEGGTTKEGCQFMQKQWQRFRAAAQKTGLRILGIGVPEPHKDGTIHKHLVVWTDDGPKMEEMLRLYFLDADNPGEAGANKSRVQVEAPKYGTEGAIGYCLKYALKYSLDSEKPQTRERLAVNAWRNLYGLRRLDWFAIKVQQGKIGVWREARRAGNVPIALQTVVTAAKEGDWHKFGKVCTGVGLLKEYRINRYGERYAKVVGLESEGGSLVRTRSQDWEIVSVAQREFEKRLETELKPSLGEVNPTILNAVTDDHIRPRTFSEGREAGSRITPSTGLEDLDDWDVPWDTPEATQDDQDPPF